MTRYKGKITRENALDIIRQFAMEYRRELGKTPGEIIFVGGGSIMLNYKFRDTTQDFDVILKTVSGVRDVILKFAYDNDLPRDWMNSDFMSTSSYSSILSEVSKHYCSLNNGTLEIRTVSGVYLIAMKLKARRDYRNDISDVMGIIIEEGEAGNNISFENIQDAYVSLYDESIPADLSKKMRDICSMGLEELKKQFQEQNNREQEIGGRIISYIDAGANINAANVEDVLSKIRKRLKSQKDKEVKGKFTESSEN